MNIAIISASHRKNSNSLRATQWISESMGQYDLKPQIFDLSELELPFWTEDFWTPDSRESHQWSLFSQRLSACDGVVIVSPEWAGMCPPKLTNFLLLCSSQELAYKPAFLVGVSAGASGTYPIAALRMSASKNNQMIFLPEHLIIRHASDFFSQEPNLEGEHFQNSQSRLNQRLHYNLPILREMAADLRKMRANINMSQYPFGM